MVSVESEPDQRVGPGPGDRGSRGTDRFLAAALGLLSAVFALLIPFLPVVQSTASVTWPTASTGTAPIDAPLVAYRPEALQITLTCDAIRSLDERTPGPATVLATVPPQAPHGAAVGLQVGVADGVLTVDNRGQRAVTEPLPAPGPGCAFTLISTDAATTATLGGSTVIDAAGDVRPQVVGVHSDLDGALDPMSGTSVSFDTDNRYDTSATGLKAATGVLAAVSLAGCLWFLRRIDDRDGRRIVHGRRLAGVLRGRDSVRDAVVVGVLAVWAVIGSMTSDDGYILAISRGNDAAGYIGNYFRWFNSPEAPFGWFYQLYSLWSGVSEAVLWLRLPALAMGIASWFLISRALLPRLGTRVRRSRSAGWAAAGVFLCFWLPFDNGLRPESVVVIAALVSLVMLERALATRRLLPVAGALIAAAFAVAATPTGLIALAPFLAATRPLLRLFTERAARAGWVPTLAPLLAAGLIVLLAVFGDQTWATISEATRVRTELGPNLSWYQELSRYDLLFAESRDGSLQRRFPVLLLWLCTAVAGAVLLRRGRIPGAALGFSRRLLGSTVLSFAVLALTPTKWTHHFGAFAALAAGVAALAALATSTGVLRSRRNQALFLAAVLAVTALAFTGPNTWWYVSNWGVPWFDKPPSVAGFSATGMLLGLAGISLVVGMIEHLRTPGVPRPVPPSQAGGRRSRRRGGQARAVRLGSAPIALICAFMVLFQVASLAKGMEKQAGSYSLGADIIGDPTGSQCGLAGRLLVETDPAASVLPPAPPGALDEPPLEQGFVRDGLPPTGPGSLRDNDGTGESQPGITGTGPQGGPVSGSWSPDPEHTGDYRSGWYTLPEAARRGEAPLVLGIAGTIGGANSLTLEFASGDRPVETITPSGNAGTVTSVADNAGTAAGGTAWRDIRLDLSGTAAAEADRVRVVASDRGLGPNSWLAVAQPRVPQLTPLTDVVGGRPGYLDWPTAFVHPCLRRFDVNGGIADVPAFRLLADTQQRSVGDEWGAASGGGPRGWTALVGAERVLPTYLPGEWDFDWGQFRIYEPYTPQSVPAPVERGERTMWGWQQVGGIGAAPGDPPPLPG
ncbi:MULTISPECIES: arabinosyltransferase domain-containing protein [Pseudonocardia]|uniref:Arabinosyltransferase n=1 Tax=Pseudonocardia saturnea TaxID=33909 RepID=A0ABQ0RU79_9PSEU|nr:MULTISPECIES: arabinosyltransferase domain-containing protein [Pseudonocardia]BBF98969.1 arabinosyltransferase [Pseudonocardia autotrophica]GEC23889.1 arabinosyltransferase [Pseudonocardia saturnea]